ncbi:MAG TPA: methionine synthase [Chloroflexota bacterium]|jgi:5-methyltetrahydropteroyltriglutamate--homocysteine methyltransferase
MARSRGAAAVAGAAPEVERRDGLDPLATTVVGSYSVPEWLERLKTDYHHRRISGAYLEQIHEVAIKASLKDQELAGIDIVSDGEIRRDNDVDYFLVRVPGVEIPHLAKAFYYDYYEAVVRHPIPADGPPLGLADDFRFTREQTDRPIKFSFTGPLSLAKRVRNEAYADEADLVLAFAGVLNREARLLAAAGATLLQIDEPFLAGYRDQVELAVRAINAVVAGVDVHWALHVCYGNRYARPLWEGHYDFLFPAILDARVDQLVLEFARKGYDDLELFRRHPVPFVLGLGVIDVKSREVETAELVASRVRRALQVLPPERVVVNPDCGLRHLPPDVARAKLRAMAAGTAIVRREIAGAAGPSRG